MQLFFAYLWQRRHTLAVYAVFCAVFAAVFALYHLPLAAMAYPALLCALLGACLLAVDFARLHRRLRQLAALCRQPDALPEGLPPPQSAVEAGYQRLVGTLRRELAAMETDADARYRDMVDYYTVWAHQIKTPIASMRLALQNEDTPLARRLGGDLFRIEQYVEMVLAFLRLDSPTTDYVFRPCEVDDVIRQAAKKFAAVFIDRRIRLDYTPAALRLVTDEKWLGFVVEQLLSNALKYTPEGGCVTIAPRGEKTLCIEDTGIGIAPEDLPRIFEKGYTGCNGRADRRASGLGLYLCKRVCEGLGIGLRVTSEPGQGTCVWLDLAQYQLRPE